MTRPVWSKWGALLCVFAVLYNDWVHFSCSIVSDSLWPHGMQYTRPPLSITNPWSLLKLMSIESVMPSNHLILCRSLLLPPSIFASIRAFSDESVLTNRWPKIGVSASVLPMNIQEWLPLGWTGWISLLTLKSLLQHHSSKGSTLQHSTFFIVQLTHPYMTTGKSISLTRWTFVGNVISLLFNMLSRLVITFLLRRKCLLISWLQSHLQWFWAPPK